jgi:hypothetical protein
MTALKLITLFHNSSKSSLMKILIEMSTLMVTSGGTKRDRFAVNLVLDVLRYTIWQCKLMKNRISYHTIELETLDILETVGRCSNKIKFSINQCGFINTDGDRRQRLQHPP